MTVRIMALGLEQIYCEEVIHCMERQWGHYYRESKSSHNWRQELFLNVECLPITIIAIINHFGAEKLAGFASLNVYEAEDTSKSVWLERVYVLEEHRNHGIAKQLVNQLINYAEIMLVDGASIQYIELRTLSAKDIYLKLGWQDLGTEIYHSQEVTRMRRRLKAPILIA
jgi:GNAT superfamily N-acetyltransferase